MEQGRRMFNFTKSKGAGTSPVPLTPTTQETWRQSKPCRRSRLGNRDQGSRRHQPLAKVMGAKQSEQRYQISRATLFLNRHHGFKLPATATLAKAAIVIRSKKSLSFGANPVSEPKVTATLRRIRAGPWTPLDQLGL
jgi:hypothetical protein